MLAGLSPDYVMRLEQGRDHRPSERVLKALALALQLDSDATAHLVALGRAERPLGEPGPAPEEVVRPELRELLDTWTATPAIIHGWRLDVLASNAVAQALTLAAQPGVNMLRTWFLNVEERRRYADDEQDPLGLAVAYFRSTVGSDSDDPRVTDLIAELSDNSDEFREMWARHDVHSALVGAGTPYDHPLLGSVRLRFQTFAVDNTDRQRLIVMSAVPGSDDAHALARLATAAAEGRFG